MTNPIHVFSEIGKLKTVLLHRPGKELENLAPKYLSRMLIDDIPYLKIADGEHDAFAQLLKAKGIKVLYLEDLLSAALKEKDVQKRFVDQILAESGIKDNDNLHLAIKEFLLSLPVKDMVAQVISGITKKEVKLIHPSLADLAETPDYPFYLDPMPNAYFMRDQQAAIGEGMTINRMTFRARRRESLFMKTILLHHPDFKDQNIPIKNT